MALLRNTPLTEDQVKEVVRGVVAEESHAPVGHHIDHDEIEKFVEGVTHHDAGPENIRRVAATLAAAGWPLDNLDDHVDD